MNLTMISGEGVQSKVIRQGHAAALMDIWIIFQINDLYINLSSPTCVIHSSGTPLKINKSDLM